MVWSPNLNMSSLPTCCAYRNASSLPSEFWSALCENEPAANLILPFALKAKASELASRASGDQLWVVLYDHTGKRVEFVLSCTEGPLGNYPIFIFTPKSSAQLAQDEASGENIPNSLSQLALCLLNEVRSRERIFSVFSVAYVAEKFAWALQEHGVQPLVEPYYDSIFTFCTADTLSQSPEPFKLKSEDALIRICLADMSHLEEIKGLCKAFVETSPPYTLDDEGAEIEARQMITNKQVWVHLIQEGNNDWEIACLVATTRQSENVTAVTKVFTAKKWRSRGCAGRLLYRICSEILRGKDPLKKDRVVLYVGTGDDLAPARRAYHKVGFQGLDPQNKVNVENVERWVEIGFKDTTLGYW